MAQLEMPGIVPPAFTSTACAMTTAKPRVCVLLDAHAKWTSRGGTSPQQIRDKLWRSFTTFVRLVHASAMNSPSIVVLAVDARDSNAHPHITVLADAISVHDPRALHTADLRLQAALDAAALPLAVVSTYAHALLREASAFLRIPAQSDGNSPVLHVFTAPLVADALRSTAAVACPAYTLCVHVPSALRPTTLAEQLSGSLASVLRFHVTLELLDVGDVAPVSSLQLVMQPRGAAPFTVSPRPAQLQCVQVVTVASVQDDVGYGAPLVAWGDAAANVLISGLRRLKAALLCVDASLSMNGGNVYTPMFTLVPALASRVPELALVRLVTPREGLFPLPPHHHSHQDVLVSTENNPSVQYASLFTRTCHPVPLDLDSLPSNVIVQQQKVAQPAARKVRFDVDLG